MCITFFGFNCHTEIKFFLLFNRDEYLNRPTIPIKLYEGYLLYSLDEKSGGTFLCVNIKNGNFSCLLNHEFKENPYSATTKFKRGSLPIEFCKEENFEAFFKKLKENQIEYNGFNLLCGNLLLKKMFYFTNNNQMNDKLIELPIELDLFNIYSIENTWIFNEIFATLYGKEKLKSFFDCISYNNLNPDDLFKMFFNLMFDSTSDNSFVIDTNDKESFNDQCIFKKCYNYFKHEINYLEFGTRQTICFYMSNENKFYLTEHFKIIEKSNNKLYINENNDLITRYEYIL